MPMGTDGMGMMGEMEMSGPDNTLPMMTGDGQFGPIEMGGMFTTVKVREGLSRGGDFKDPGWYEHPRGTVAHEVKVDDAIAKEKTTSRANFWQSTRARKHEPLSKMISLRSGNTKRRHRLDHNPRVGTGQALRQLVLDTPDRPSPVSGVRLITTCGHLQK